MELRGEHVVLRPLTTDDIEAVAEIQSEPGVARWWGDPSPSELRDLAEGRDECTAFVSSGIAATTGS